MNGRPRRALVVGASQAGLSAARALRRLGFDGELTVVGDEEHLPYDRPPLSKQVLAGEWPPERTALLGDADADLDVTWRLGRRAAALDVERRTVSLDDGDDVPYDGLVIACGARPRTLPGTETVAGVHALRTLDDAVAVRDAVAGGARVLVVGAGFIGAEVAATCREVGAEVTMVEPLPVPLGRVLGEDVGRVVADVHRDHGVDLRTGVGVDRLETADGRVTGAVLADGSTVACDLAVVGIGVVPATGWLEGSGLALDDGVVADATCRAGPGVVVAGDVARWYHRRYGEHVRIEHWDHAIAMGAHAAATLLAGDDALPFEPVPWFWSDQYDRKLMLAGRVQGADEVRVVDGSLDERRFVALYRRGDEVVAALGMNRPAPLARWRARLADRVGWDEAITD